MEKRGRKKGTHKTGGRKAGTPNVATSSFREKLDLLNFDIAAEAIALFKSSDTAPEIKFKLLVFLSEYSLNKPAPLPPITATPPPTPEAKLSDSELEASVGS